MSQRLAQARLKACGYWPFASHAILSLVPVERPGLGTLAVDKHWRLYYDEAALERFSAEEAAGIILHEVDHLLKRHHKRGNAMVTDDSQWETWNYATDAAINGDLQAQGISLPTDVVLPEKLNLATGLSAEEYFRKLNDQRNQHSNQQGDSNEATDPTTHDCQAPEPSDSRTGKPADSGAAESPAPERESAGTDGNAGDDSGSEVEPQPVGVSGSCSDGRQRSWELGPPADDTPGLDQGDAEQLIHTTAKNVLEKQKGKGSGGMRRWAEQVINPPIDPAAKLLHLVRRACDVTVGMGERSYRRPSRRGSDPRMALPSNVAPLPRITVIVDTSGSMGRNDLGLALGTIRKVLHSFRIRDGIQVVTGDTQGQAKRLCLSDLSKIELTGGGGTDMAAIIEQVLEERPRPQMIVVCTDGWTPWPTANPGIPIVACITSKLATLPTEYVPPRFITTLELKGN